MGRIGFHAAKGGDSSPDDSNHLRDHHTSMSSRAAAVEKSLTRTKSLLSGGTTPVPTNDFDGKDGQLSVITDSTLGELNRELVKRQAWYTRTPFYCVVFFVIIGLCVFSMIYPARLIPKIVNMGPTANQAARRRFQTRALVHYSRELLLNDNFARSSRTESTINMIHYRDELMKSDAAVRRGDTLGVGLGADFRNLEHNHVMYDLGCPWHPRWKYDGHPHNEDLTYYCVGSINIDAVSHGLSYLYSTFDDAAGEIINKYGCPKATGDNGAELTEEEEFAIKEEERESRLRGEKAFMEVDLNRTAEGLAIIQSDENLVFMQEAFEDDLYRGWDLIMEVFHHESDALLEEAHFEFLLFYCIYVGALLCLFYLILFRRSLLNAVEQARKAQEWVSRVPFHTLSKDQRHLVELYFLGAEQLEAMQEAGETPASMQGGSVKGSFKADSVGRRRSSGL
jgi:hypothetical protein